MFAHFIDSIVLSILCFAISFASLVVLAAFGTSVLAFNSSPLMILSSGIFTAMVLPGLLVCALFTSLIYFVLTLGSPKQATWGMRLMDVRIRYAYDSQPVGKGTIFLRHFLFWLPSIITPLLISSWITNAITILITKRKQTYYDMLTKTVYVMSR